MMMHHPTRGARFLRRKMDDGRRGKQNAAARSERRRRRRPDARTGHAERRKETSRSPSATSHATAGILEKMMKSQRKKGLENTY